MPVPNANPAAPPSSAAEGAGLADGAEGERGGLVNGGHHGALVVEAAMAGVDG
jgi:hypothetical protein